MTARRVRRALGTLLPLIGLALASVVMGWLVHEWQDLARAEQEPTPELIAYQDAIAFLEECRETHQFFIDNPEWCNASTGNVTRHRDLIAGYNQVLELLYNDAEEVR